MTAAMGRPTPGTLYCIPTPVGEGRTAPDDLAAGVMTVIGQLDYLIAENAKTARAVWKYLPLSRPIQQIQIVELNQHTREEAVADLLAPLLAGRSAGLVSEAGCPGVADPGARLVLAAHQAGVPVQPLIGPSALLLALMGSGLNGQRFAFAGYLPTAAEERHRQIRRMESRSQQEDETQILIETPYRNQVLFSALLAALSPHTWLCVASDLTGRQQALHTRRVADWTRPTPSLPRAPTVFAFWAPR